MCKQGDLSLDPSTHLKSRYGGRHFPGVEEVNPATHWPARIAKWVKSSFSKDLCLQNKGGKPLKTTLVSISGPTHACACTHTQTCTTHVTQKLKKIKKERTNHKETLWKRPQGHSSLCLGQVSTTVTGLDFRPNFSILVKLPSHHELPLRYTEQE